MNSIFFTFSFLSLCFHLKFSLSFALLLSQSFTTFNSFELSLPPANCDWKRGVGVIGKAHVEPFHLLASKLWDLKRVYEAFNYCKREIIVIWFANQSRVELWIRYHYFGTEYGPCNQLQLTHCYMLSIVHIKH